MRTIGNILWFIFGGVFWSISLFLLSALMCITIIGIPLGLQLYKLARFVFWPFGKQVVSVTPSGFNNILNILWAIVFGWEMALGFALTGLLFYITIIGAPFGHQYFKMAVFVLLPFGNDFL